jgi:multiple sugar transport system permease protein
MRKAERLILLLFLAPSLALLAIFTFLPALWAIAISLTNMALVGPEAIHPRMVGAANYAKLLSDHDFYRSLAISFQFVFFSAIVGQFVLGLLSALLLNRPGLRGASLLSAAILLPLAVPETVASMSWASMLAPGEFGTVNRILIALGGNAVNWLQIYPMQSIVLINIWRGIAFAMITFLAALQSVPTEVLEAAEVDGASPWQRLIYITLPLIRYVILLFMLLTTITTMAIFGFIYFLTRGGPAGATTLISIYIYERSFRFFELGYGSSVAVVVLVITLAIGLIYVRSLRVKL